MAGSKMNGRLYDTGSGKLTAFNMVKRKAQATVKTLMLCLLCALVLSGCAVKFIYNQLDWLVPWYLDDYVSFNPGQQIVLDARLEQYLSWHRTQQLPRYADFLEQVIELIEDGLTAEELDAIQQQSEQFADVLIARMLPGLADFLGHLDEAQREELFENLARQNDEFREQYIELSEKKQRINRVKEVRKFVQRWTGMLDEAQVKMLVTWSKQYLLMGEEFLQSRLAWQQRLNQVLQKRDDRAYLESALGDLFTSRTRDRPEGYQQKYDHNEKLLKQLYLSLDRSLSEEQRQHMIEQLKSYAEDFRELASAT